jgi:hypothetical protein
MVGCRGGEDGSNVEVKRIQRRTYAAPLAVVNKYKENEDARNERGFRKTSTRAILIDRT